MATKKALVPLANEPIISGRSIWLFTHIKNKNLSTGDDFIHSSGIIISGKFFATSEVVAPLANDAIIWGKSIKSFRYLEHQNPSIISKS